MDGIDLSQLKEISIPRPLVLRLPECGIKLNMFPDGSEVQLQFITQNPVFPVALEIPFPPSYLRNIITQLETLYEKATEAQENSSV